MEEELQGPYRQLVGRRMWVANLIRPDVMEFVRGVARQAQPNSSTLEGRPQGAKLLE